MLLYQFEPDPYPDDSLYACVLSEEESLRHSLIGNTTPSSVTDDKFVCTSSDCLSLNLSDEDGLPSLSNRGEVLLYQFEPDPSPDDSSYACVLSEEESLRHSQIGNTNW